MSEHRAFNPKTDFFVVGDLRDEMGVFSQDNLGPVPMRAEYMGPGETDITDKRGNQIAVWFLRDGRRKPDSFPAYWCGYKKEEMHYVTLGSDAQYMFTPTMDGCSFGIGHAGGDGSVIVSHVNSNHLEQPNSKKAMIKDQHDRLKNFLRGHGGTAKLYEPGDYRKRRTGLFGSESGISSTTFGVRESGKWRFYSHRYRGINMNAVYLDTIQIR